jgi:hypothetical protein
MKRTTRIIVNGVQYNRMEDVPEHIRDMLRDADGDGVPDIVREGRASGDAQVHTTRREWRGRIDDAPPEVRDALARMRAGDSSDPGVTHRVTVSHASTGGRIGDDDRRVLSATLEMNGWEPSYEGHDRITYRPGIGGAKFYLGGAGLAVLLSAILFIAEGWQNDPFHLAAHGLLWALAVLWTVSLSWMHISFLKDDVHGIVWMRGMRLLWPIRRRFPLGETSLHLTVSHRRPYRRPGEEGWHWHLLILAAGVAPVSMRVGFTAGRERPSGPPSDVRAHMEMFERIFRTAVHGV